jgi:ATP-dependent protease ClpP protease subunit
MALKCVSRYSNSLTQNFKDSHYKFIKIHDIINHGSAENIINEIYSACKNLHKYVCCSEDRNLNYNHKYLFFHIHSKGGSIYEAMRILQAMDYARKYFKIVTVIDSICFSVATALFCSGDNGFRFVSSYANTMIHKPTLKNHDEKHCANSNNSNSCQENEREHAQYIQNLVESIIINCLPKYSANSMDFLKELSNRQNEDWFLTPQDLIYYGLANHIGVPSLDYQIKFTPYLVIDQN